MKMVNINFIVDSLENYTIDDMKSSDCCLLFFDCSDLNSFSKIKEFIVSNSKENKIKYNVPWCLVGNKNDLTVQKNNLEKIKEFSAQNNIEFFDISVGNNYGISRMMHYVGSLYDIINNEA